MSRPGFFFLVCPDPDLARERMRAVLAEHGGGFEERTYWGDEELPEAFWQDLSAVGLFASKKALAVRMADQLPKAALSSLSSALKGFSDTLWPFFFVENEWTKKGTPKIPAELKKQKFFKVAEQNGWIWSSKGLDPKRIPKLVADWARDKGLDVDRDAAVELARILPADMAAVHTELAKLELAAENGRVRREHVELVSYAQEIDFFPLVDAIIEGRPDAQVWREVLKERPSKESLLFPLLANLVMACRQVWMIRHDEPLNLPPFLMKKRNAQARKIEPRQLAEMLELAFGAQLDVKSGRKREEQVLEELTAGLASLFARRGAAS